MSDRIAQLSEELARDPSSMAFVPLVGLLRRDGQLAVAQRVAERGAARHPRSAAALDALAHVLADRQVYDRAGQAWQAALALDPAHTGAMKGLGFLAYRDGNWSEAERWFGSVGRRSPGDPAVRVALERVRVARESAERAASPTPAPNDSVAEPEAAADPFMIDTDGLVLGGRFGEDGIDAEADSAGVELAAVAADARRALSYLRLGEWDSIVIETETGSVAVAPVSSSVMVALSAPREEHAGLVRARLARTVERARRWLEVLR